MLPRLSIDHQLTDNHRLSKSMLSDYGYLFMPDDSLNSIISYEEPVITHTHTHTSLMALCMELPGWASTRKVKPIWILLKQETASGSGIHWAICKSAPRSRQITMPAPHHSVFYRPDALPAAQATASKQWRQEPGPVISYRKKLLSVLICSNTSTLPFTKQSVH